MTISQAFGIAAVSIAFLGVLIAVGAAVAAAFSDLGRKTSDTQPTNDQRLTTNQ